MVQARILGDTNDENYVTEGPSIDEALNPGKDLWDPSKSKYRTLKGIDYFTRGSHLGIGPRTMRSGDSISEPFGCCLSSSAKLYEVLSSSPGPLYYS